MVKWSVPARNDLKQKSVNISGRSKVFDSDQLILQIVKLLPVFNEYSDVDVHCGAFRSDPVVNFEQDVASSGPDDKKWYFHGRRDLVNPTQRGYPNLIDLPG